MGRQGIHPKEVARVVIDAINHPKQATIHYRQRCTNEANRKLPEQGILSNDVTN